MSRPLCRLHAWEVAGVVAFMPHLLAIVVATSLLPRFRHQLQYLSELGERGSSTAALTNYLGLLPTGALLVCFGLGLVLHHRADRRLAIAGALIVVHGICRALAAFFVCDPGCRPEHPSLSQAVHNVVVTIAFASLTAALFTTGPWLIAARRGTALVGATYSLGCVAVVSQGLLLFGAGGSLGLYQRIALGALEMWVTLLAVHLVRSPERAA